MCATMGLYRRDVATEPEVFGIGNYIDGEKTVNRYDLILSGLGGQGVMTISRILAAAASEEDIPVKLFEGTGITQRGGGVFCFIRFGESYSPKISAGKADTIICLELSEMANVIHLLKPHGHIWTNSGTIHGYYSKLHPGLYPSQESIEEMIGEITSHLYIIPADRLAAEAGSLQAVNMLMLGAFSGGNVFPKSDSITRAIKETYTQFASSNLEAFQKGYEFSKNEGAGRQSENDFIARETENSDG